MIKISFSGISGSGKTSLLTEVKKILSLKDKAECIDELKNKNPFDDSLKFNFVSQFFYFSNQINEENIKQMSPNDYLLCDQSVLDHWILWKNFIAEKEMTPSLEEKNKVLDDLYKFWIKSYDLIFLIRMDLKELEKREFSHELKITDLDGIKRIEDLYKESVKEDGLKIIEIWNNSTIDESAHEIIKHITEFKEIENKEKENKEKENQESTENIEHTENTGVQDTQSAENPLPGNHSPIHQDQSIKPDNIEPDSA